MQDLLDDISYEKDIYNDDVEEAWKRAIAWDANAKMLALETINIVDPLFLPRVLEIGFYHQAGIFDSASGSTINDLARASWDIGVGLGRLPLGDREKAVEQFLRGLRDFGLEAAAITGLNPMDANMRRVFRAVDRLDDAEQSEAIGR